MTPAPQYHLFRFRVFIDVYGEMRETSIFRFRNRFESIVREGMEDMNASIPGQFYEWNVQGKCWMVGSPKLPQDNTPQVPTFPPALDWLP